MPKPFVGHEAIRSAQCMGMGPMHGRQAAAKQPAWTLGMEDLSMESQGNLKAHDEAANDVAGAGGVGDKAFDDITDLKNEDFVYLY